MYTVSALMVYQGTNWTRNSSSKLDIDYFYNNLILVDC